MRSQFTKLGKVLKEIRRENNNEILKDMAVRLDIDSSLLSAMETGIDEVPPYIIDRLERTYSLSKKRLDEIHQAIEQDKMLGNGLGDTLENLQKIAYTLAPKR
jgi:hypothetical protein